MKKIILFLLLTILTSFQVKPKLIYFEVETRDEAGTIVPKCLLQTSDGFDKKICHFYTDKFGKSLFSIKIMPSKTFVTIDAYVSNSVSYRQFYDIDLLNDGDTVRGIITIYYPLKK